MEELISSLKVVGQDHKDRDPEQFPAHRRTEDLILSFHLSKKPQCMPEVLQLGHSDLSERDKPLCKL